MDPNATLERMEAQLRELRELEDLPVADQRAGTLAAMRELRELRTALAGWLRCGGFEPLWSRCPGAAAYCALHRLTSWPALPAGGLCWYCRQPVTTPGPCARCTPARLTPADWGLA